MTLGRPARVVMRPDALLDSSQRSRRARSRDKVKVLFVLVLCINPELTAAVQTSAERPECPRYAASRCHYPLRPTEETMAILIIMQAEERDMQTAQLEGRRPDQYVSLATSFANVRPTDLVPVHPRQQLARKVERRSPSRSINSTWTRPTDLHRYSQAVVVGDGACGKTSLLNVYISGTFPEGYEPTVFENHCVDVGERFRMSPCSALAGVLVH